MGPQLCDEGFGAIDAGRARLRRHRRRHDPAFLRRSGEGRPGVKGCVENDGDPEAERFGKRVIAVTEPPSLLKCRASPKCERVAHTFEKDPVATQNS